MYRTNHRCYTALGLLSLFGLSALVDAKPPKGGSVGAARPAQGNRFTGKPSIPTPAARFVPGTSGQQKSVGNIPSAKGGVDLLRKIGIATGGKACEGCCRPAPGGVGGSSCPAPSGNAQPAPEPDPAPEPAPEPAPAPAQGPAEQPQPSPMTQPKQDPGVETADRLTERDEADPARQGCFAKVYTIQLKGGQNHVLDLESPGGTEWFDVYLRVEDLRGKVLAEDNDSGGRMNARITFKPPQDGDYRLVVSSFRPKATGVFFLRVR